MRRNEVNMDLGIILQRAREINASDIHFVSGSPPFVRRDGVIAILPEMKENPDYKDMLLSLMDDKTRDMFDKGYDADFAYEDPEKRRYRVNVFRQRNKVGAVFRLLNDSIPTFEDLDLPEILKRLPLLPRGLVLVTGPTGSGKSTTLAAMMDYANQNRHGHIITIEDPIEYTYVNKSCIVDQREVGADVVSYKAAIKSSMREDPDIILVGEMRDLETISAVLTAAETGHLVFSTLHTTGAAKTIDRIIDVFPPHQQQQVRIQLASVLKCVVSQQLVKKIGGGRVAAVEIMLTNDAVANMIREGKVFQINSTIQTSGRDGMVLLDKSLADLVNSNRITYEEALEKCTNDKELQRLVNKS